MSTRLPISADRLIANQVNVCCFTSPNEGTILLMLRPRFPALRGSFAGAFISGSYSPTQGQSEEMSDMTGDEERSKTAKNIKRCLC